MKKLLFLAMILINKTVFAGAWMLKPKDSEMIIHNEYKTLVTYYINPTNNSSTPSKAFSFIVYDMFYQYGLNDKINLGMQAKFFDYLGYEQIYAEEETPSYEFFEASELTIDQDYLRQENNLAELKFFAQTLLWQSEKSIVSLQPNISLYNNGKSQSFGLSFLYGLNFQIGIKTGFINLEAGVDASKSASPRFDATIGYALNSRNMIMLQSFNRQNSKFYQDDWFEESHYNEIRFSYVYKHSKAISVETGYATNISQRRNYISESITTGISIKF